MLGTTPELIKLLKIFLFNGLGIFPVPASARINNFLLNMILENYTKNC
jgi:hypothetical protein